MYLQSSAVSVRASEGTPSSVSSAALPASPHRKSSSKRQGEASGPKRRPAAAQSACVRALRQATEVEPANCAGGR